MQEHRTVTFRTKLSRALRAIQKTSALDRMENIRSMAKAEDAEIHVLVWIPDYAVSSVIICLCNLTIDS